MSESNKAVASNIQTKFDIQRLIKNSFIEDYPGETPHICPFSIYLLEKYSSLVLKILKKA